MKHKCKNIFLLKGYSFECELERNHEGDHKFNQHFYQPALEGVEMFTISWTAFVPEPEPSAFEKWWEKHQGYRRVNLSREWTFRAGWNAAVKASAKLAEEYGTNGRVASRIYNLHEGSEDD